MHVYLLTEDHDPTRKLLTALEMCRHKSVSIETLQAAVKAGHTSLLEHVSFSFVISGISRRLLAQQARHRIGVSPTVESQRSVDMTDFQYHIPTAIDEDNTRRAIFEHAMNTANRAYKNLLSVGVAREDAAYVLPEAVHTTEMLTMNGRAIRHFYILRSATGAQAEIRQLANKIRELVEPLCPVIFYGL